MENGKIPVNWRGTEKSLLPRSFGMKLYPLLIPTPHHTILFKIPKGADNILESYPENFHDIWDDKHVKMPCSVFEKENKNRWDIIVASLSKPIKKSEQLEDAIMSYNLKYKGKWRFHLLHSFFENVLTKEEETDEFFENLLPKIINLALELPTFITSPIPLLKQNNNHSISISQIQIACLLANAFLCTFPNRNGDYSEYKTYPQINFNGLFQMKVQKSNDKYLYEKLKCIINYFKKVTDPNFVCKRAVTYSRRYLPENELPTWSKLTNQLTNLHIASTGTIENDGDGMYQVDFADKSIGGKVIGMGSVQEEIRFLICPELIVSQLFSQKMLPTESIIITGAERFNDYSGYSKSFKWGGNYTDDTPIDDNSHRRYCTVVAIDALYFRNPKLQFDPKNLSRELNKAYAGFSWGNKSDCSDVSVATGNWGCGVFRGDCHLKSLLQMLSAAEAKRDVVYFTFGKTTTRDSINDMHSFLKNKNVTVGEIFRILIKYNEYMQSHSKPNLYEFIKSTVNNSVVQKPQNKQIPPAVIDGQLNVSKNASQSVREKPIQSTSILKRERNEETEKKKKKRKIDEHFQSAS
ncbi:poly(ADP-ribose) glycohydrolase-like isoform X2 [Adelges cooleyi]|uniref:poly(ADP-ribose) glycohydrolase-like isoform X2 n=1 Tax=Adelges cooleyi TaxID=133065 RepID=UPI00217FA45F|nr:poly(ADP-ribose) glycohydrolase-like isoform X2 [Adelges cooleyi]